MSPLRRNSIPLGFLLLLAGPLCAETPQQAGNRLIRQCLDALGGQAFLEMRDKVLHGRAYQFYEGRLSGLTVMTVYTQYEKKPSSPAPGWIGVRERRDFGKNHDYSALFADGKGWDITFRGARPLPEAQMRQYYDRLRRDIFYILKYRLDEPGMICESAGADLIENQPADVVRITDNDNNTVTVYLLQLTHLPVRQEYLRRDPGTRETFREAASYSKYRTVSGVQLPTYSQLVRDGEKIFEMFGDSLEVNKGLNESIFTLKKGIRILPADKEK
jgi:hypothetical protein